jgi:hypothetical protein
MDLAQKSSGGTIKRATWSGMEATGCIWKHASMPTSRSGSMKGSSMHSVISGMERSGRVLFSRLSTINTEMCCTAVTSLGLQSAVRYVREVESHNC